MRDVGLSKRRVSRLGAYLALSERMPIEKADELVRSILEYCGLAVPDVDEGDPVRRQLLAPYRRPPQTGGL